MIVIRAERCSGCGACVEVCPSGALYLLDGLAAVDGALCRECEACLAVCPVGAIVVGDERKPVAEPVRVPALRPKPEVVQVKVRSTRVPMRSRMKPVVGAALAWAGREVVPRLTDYLLRMTEHRPRGRLPDERDLTPVGEAPRWQHRNHSRGGSNRR